LIPAAAVTLWIHEAGAQAGEYEHGEAVFVMADAVLNEIKFSDRMQLIDLVPEADVPFDLIGLPAGSVISGYHSIVESEPESIPVIGGVPEINPRGGLCLIEMFTRVDVADIIRASCKDPQLALDEVPLPGLRVPAEARQA
jgi:hypothetical protein